MSQFSINKDPNGKFAQYYHEAKMLTTQILLNVSFINKAEAGARLELVNKRLTLCKQNANFDIYAAARVAREIDDNMAVITSAYKRAA